MVDRRGKAKEPTERGGEQLVNGGPFVIGEVDEFDASKELGDHKGGDEGGDHVDGGDAGGGDVGRDDVGGTTEGASGGSEVVRPEETMVECGTEIASGGGEGNGQSGDVTTTDHEGNGRQGRRGARRSAVGENGED